jgi:hypothetical protein
MPATVATMSVEELKEIIGEVVERKFVEMFGDPDNGMEISARLRERLVRQKSAVADGERGETFEDVAERLGLN